MEKGHHTNDYSSPKVVQPYNQFKIPYNGVKPQMIHHRKD